MVNKGEWVQIHKRILNEDQRAPQVPEDTKHVPLEMWVKGYLVHEAELGDEVEIETVTGRKVTGKLVAVNPVFTHSFGDYMPEISEIHKRLNQEMEALAKND